MKTAGLADLKKAAAFTLLEMLTTFGVVAVLAGLAGLSAGHAKTRAREVQCLSQMHQIALGVMDYAADHQGRLPPENLLPDGDPFDCWLALRESIASPVVFHCPADRRFRPATQFDTLTEADISYTVGVQARSDRPLMLLSTDRYLSDACFVAETLHEAYWETQLSPAHGAGRGNGLRVDGSARSFNGADLRQALAESLRVAERPYVEFLLPGDQPLEAP